MPTSSKHRIYVVRQPGKRWLVHAFTEMPERYIGYDDNNGVRSFVHKFGVRRGVMWHPGEPECRSSLKALGLSNLANIPLDTIATVDISVASIKDAS